MDHAVSRRRLSCFKENVRAIDMKEQETELQLPNSEQQGSASLGPLHAFAVVELRPAMEIFLYTSPCV